MKNLKIKVCLIAFITGILFTSCSQEDNVNSKKETSYGLMSNKEDLSTFTHALEITGLSSQLSSTEMYTVFAPSNTAFSNFLAENNFNTVDAVPANILREILLNHIISGEINKVDLPISGYLHTEAKGFASAVNPLSIYFRKVDGITVINGMATINNSDIKTSNGVIHLIDHVLEFPSIVDQVVANPNLSTLFTIMDTNSQYDFVSELSGVNNGPYTFYAPMDSAFPSLLTELGVPNLSAIDDATKAKVLKYHMVITTNSLSNSLTNGSSFNTLEGDSFSIQNTSANFRVIDINSRLANVTTKDIQCYNGVIHMIDRVLLPN
jgi:uncharacterized surface protein with fasciclin (FAS1) repeats